MVCWRREVSAYCRYLCYSVQGTGRGGREWGMRRYSGEGLSTRVYGGEAERRSRDAWGKRVLSATRAGHREKRRVHREEHQWSPSPVRPKRKQALQFTGGDGSEERPYVELGLLSNGVLVEEEPVASGSGVVEGDRTPVMVTAPSTPVPASLESSIR